MSVTIKKIVSLSLVFMLLSGVVVSWGCARPSVDELIQDLSSGDDKEQYHARQALIEIGVPAVEPLIVVLNESNSSSVLNATAYALGEIGDSRAIDPLITMMHSEDIYLQSAAEWGLETFGEPAVPALIACFKNEDNEIRERAESVLSKIGLPAVESLIDALGDEIKTVRYSAHQTLIYIGEPAVEPLIAAMSDNSFIIQDQAANLLIMLEDTRAIPVLTQFYKYLYELLQESGLQEATDYNSEPVPHTVVLLDSSRDKCTHPWTYEIPRDWISVPIRNIEFACIVNEEWVEIDKTTYIATGFHSGSWVVARKQHKVELVLKEVRTGSLIASKIFNGTLPREFPEEMVFTSEKSKDIYGDEVSFSEVQSWLSTWLK